MKKLLLPIFVLSLVLGSCDVTSLNENEKDPTDVPADPLFTNAQVSLGTFIHNSNVNLNIFKLIAQYWTTTTYVDEPQYQLDNRTIPSNVWIEIYRDILVDLQEAEAIVNNNDLLDDEVRQNKLATLEIMDIYSYYLLVTIWGNVPYSESLNFENTQPTFDDAEDIYMDLLDRLDAAIAQFNTNAAGFGGADIFYGQAANPIEQWIKFANALKMRLAITVADAEGFEQRAQTAIEEASPNAFTSNADNAVIPFQAAPPHTNPVWEALVQSGRDDYLPSEPFVSRLNNLNDPRRPIFMDTTATGVYTGGDYGEQNDYADFSHFSAEIERQDRQGMILGYSEVEFIRAEAAARGYNVAGTAAENYAEAIRADMEYWEVPTAEIDAYLAQPEVAYSTAGGDFRQTIGSQKWLALFLQGHQGWTEFRRLGYPVLEAPPEAAAGAGGEVPVRFTYPIDEQNFNFANYEQAAEAIGGDELTTRLFWDTTPPQ